MKRVIDEGKTLLVDGPASVFLLTGNVNVLGAPLKIEKNLVVRQGKRLPLWVTETATLELRLGEGASITEVEAGTIPYSWNEAAKELLSLDKPVTVMVVGGVDSGKTSFSTFLVNAAVKENLKTSIIDADLGQSDVGPPSTVGFNFVAEPVKDLFEIDAQDAIFVGSTSPSGTINKVIEGLTSLKSRVMDAGTDFLVINTDGWVEGEEAVEYKVQLGEKVVPTALVGLQHENELTPILEQLVGIKVLVVDSPHLIQPRNREKRKVLRELTYKKYMKGAKVQSFFISWIKVENSLLGSGCPLNRSRLETLYNLLEKRPVYAEENLTDLLVVLKKNENINEKQLKAVEEHFEKRVKMIHEGDEQGMLVGLKDEEDHFLGIGILHEVDYKRKAVKIYTPVTQKVSALCFGQIKLNKNFRETSLSTVYSNTL